MSSPTREEIGEKYLEALPYEPYPVQEEAILAWFMTEQGVLVTAPTGTGKTLIAEGAMYEALALGKRAYYTTPLIALTEQKFHELEEAAEKWGFSADDVGLVTGNRQVKPDAKILVVVAEILLNRLLHPESFQFEECSAVVMDEFHSFNDPERGIVWELSLGMLPKHVRLLLLSATVGNAAEFLVWLQKSHGRKLDLVRGTERRVPLSYHWVGESLIGDHIVEMAKGTEAERKTPALVFCFNREECWTVGEHLKGLDILAPEQREPLREEIERHDWSKGIGVKLKQLLWRGVGVHHAGVLPKYRRIVEKLFVRKLLPVVMCTETLSAGLNLPARSVVLTELLKGPRGKKRLVNASIAHQIFGRAGRPQFDTEGNVYALAHEDDVKISKWEHKFKSIPEDTKDPGLIKYRKSLVKKKPTRRANVQYWNEQQFQKLIEAPPSNLASHGPLPWRLLAYLLQISPDVDRLRQFVRRRLLEPAQIERGVKNLTSMLIALHRAEFIELDPAPAAPKTESKDAPEPAPQPEPARPGLMEQAGILKKEKPKESKGSSDNDGDSSYEPEWARPRPELSKILAFRSIHPIYGAYLLDLLGQANDNERLAAMESVLSLPGPILRFAHPPLPEEMPPGPLEREFLDPALEEMGLMAAHLLQQPDEQDDDDWEDEPIPPSLADKLRMLFDASYPGVHDVRTQTAWAAGEILRFGGDFDKYVRTFKLVKQEGIVFRHVLRLILLCGEFAVLTPSNTDDATWKRSMGELARRLTLCCRDVDPVSTQKMLEMAHGADVVEGSEAPDEGKLVDSATDEDAWEKQWNTMLGELMPEKK